MNLSFPELLFPCVKEQLCKKTTYEPERLNKFTFRIENKNNLGTEKRITENFARGLKEVPLIFEVRQENKITVNSRYEENCKTKTQKHITQRLTIKNKTNKKVSKYEETRTRNKIHYV